MEIKNRDYSTNNITGNRIIIDFKTEFIVLIKTQLKRRQSLSYIIVRLYKGLLLLFELVGVDGNQSTNTYHNNEEQSQIE